MSEDFNENDLIFKLVKIYLVEYLTTVHGFKNFQHEAINILALYVLKTLQKLTHSIKRMLSLQGITIPNCLHIVDNIHQNKSIDILQLIEFITKQGRNSTKSIQVFSSGIESNLRVILDLCRSLFAEETEEINSYKPDTTYSNIKSIPYVYVYKAEENPLSIRAPVDEGLKKPAEYTYKNLSSRVEKVEKTVEKLSNYTIREMKRSLGTLNYDEDDEKETKGDMPRKIPPEHQNGQLASRNVSENSFSMINFL